MKEQVVVDHITRWLEYRQRYHINVHGSIYSSNGTPDILSHDKSGRLLGIEAKAPGRSPVRNQWSHAIQIIQSGGRYIVAQEDFDLDKVDNHEVPVIEIGNQIGHSDFVAAETIRVHGTHEIKLIDE